MAAFTRSRTSSLPDMVSAAWSFSVAEEIDRTSFDCRFAALRSRAAIAAKASDYRSRASSDSRQRARSPPAARTAAAAMSSIATSAPAVTKSSPCQTSYHPPLPFSASESALRASRRIQPRSPRALSNPKSCQSRVSLPQRRFHDVRHSCATLLLVQGVSPRVVMEVLGHSEVGMTLNTYSHVIPQLRREAAERMNQLLEMD